MRKITLILSFVFLVKSASAQQVVLICYQNPGGNPICVPVSTTNPLPVVAK